MQAFLCRLAWLTFLTAACQLCYADSPAITFITSAPAIASGSSTTLSWAATCPTGSCTYSIDQGLGSVSVSGTRTVSPATTKTYTLLVNNAGVGIFARSVTVFVGNGNLNVTQSLAPANGGPGCAIVPRYGVCELTYTYATAGCSRYIPSTTPCSGGTVTNPWEDVTIQATFTGRQTNATYTVYGFYEGGANSGDGNQWKVRFSPQAYDGWDYRVTFSSAADFRVITMPSLFTSAPASGSGFLALYGPANYNLLKTADGHAFYPLALNNGGASDLGNNTAGSMPMWADFGFGPSPSNGYQSSVTGAGSVLSPLVTSGFNLLRIGAGFASVPIIAGLGVNNNVYLAGNGGVTKSRGSMTWDALLRESSQSGMKNWCTVVNSPINYLPNLDVFANTAVTQQFMRAWQYAINRYGAYCDIWELGNEQPAVIPYMTTFATWVKQQDPYRHLTMMSFPPASPVANLDLGSDHQYPNYPVNPLLTLAGSFSSLISTQHANLPNSPIIYGEIGNSANDSDPQANEQFRQFENVAFFNQAFVSPWPSPVCNGIESFNLCTGSQQQAQMAVFASFISSLDTRASKLSLSLSGGTNRQTLLGYALGSPSDLAGWILNTTNRTVVHGATVQLTLPGSNMAGEWIDPATGVVISTFTTSASPGGQTLTIPDFSTTKYNGDIWFRIRSSASPVVTTVTAPGCLINNSCSLTLTAAGGAGGYSWAVTSGILPPGLSLDPSSGIIAGTANTAGNWNFTVAVRDSFNVPSAAQKLILVVFPALAIGNTQMDNFIVGHTLGAFHLPIVVTGGVPPITCTVSGNVPPGLTFNDYCGGSGTPTVAGIYRFTATAKDGQGNTAAATMTAPVLSGVVAIEQTGNPNATLNTPFNWSNITARQGSGGYTWAVTSGSLPAGLAVSALAGQASITGTPTAAGSFTFSLTATDTTGHASDPQPYTLIVNPPPAISTSALPQYSSGAPYFTTIAASDGTGPLWCSVLGALPSGFLLDSAACTIYGTSFDTTLFPLIVTVFDANGATASAALALSNAVIGGPGPVIFPGGIVPVFSTSTTIQPGSWASIYGSNLATGIAVWNGDFPTSLGGTSVTVDGRPAYLWFVSPGQINFQVPDDASTGPVQVVVNTPNGMATAQVTLGPYGPAFLLLPDGKHVTAIVITPGSPGNSGAGYDVVSPDRPVRAGETVVIYGVGFGPTKDVVAAGAAYGSATSTTNPVQVVIGGTTLPQSNVMFAGLVGAGLYQLNVLIPPGLGTGDLSLAALIGGAQTQSGVFLSVSQ
ncbi:MAG: putative Ig domain-containing protein [Acidobacteriota bacterium]|nr:putative Ig domain-containing protein [Acidobacteriota bacterium]